MLAGTRKTNAARVCAMGARDTQRSVWSQNSVACMNGRCISCTFMLEKTKPVQPGNPKENVHFASNTWEEKDVQGHVNSTRKVNKNQQNNWKATVPLSSILFPSPFHCPTALKSHKSHFISPFRGLEPQTPRAKHQALAPSLPM